MYFFFQALSSLNKTSCEIRICVEFRDEVSLWWPALFHRAVWNQWLTVKPLLPKEAPSLWWRTFWLCSCSSTCVFSHFHAWDNSSLMMKKDSLYLKKREKKIQEKQCDPVNLLPGNQTLLILCRQPAWWRLISSWLQRLSCGYQLLTYNDWVKRFNKHLVVELLAWLFEEKQIWKWFFYATSFHKKSSGQKILIWRTASWPS